MPHDKFGMPLGIDDEVIVRCTVNQISTGDEYCNVTLLTVEPMYPGETQATFALNAKQVEKVIGPVPEGDDEPPVLPSEVQ